MLPSGRYQKVVYEIYLGVVDQPGWNKYKSFTCSRDTMAERWINERQAFAHARSWVKVNGEEDFVFKICRVEYINDGSWISETYTEPKETNPIDFMRGDVLARSNAEV